MSGLPSPIREYIHNWMENQFNFGYVLVDGHGAVLSWGGLLEQLGLPPMEKGRLINDQLLFTEGLIPTETPSLYLPLVKIDSNHCLDVHIFHTDEGYCLFLVDVTNREKIISELQQKINETALRYDQQGLPGDDSDRNLQELFSAMDFAGFRRFDDDRLHPIGRLPGWWLTFFPALSKEIPLLWDTENDFSFLANFLGEACSFWEKKEVGYIKSGIWIQADDSDDLDREHLFEAFAVMTHSAALMIVTHDLHLHGEKQALIQKGRELAMDHELLQHLHCDIAKAHHILEKTVQRRTYQLQTANRRLSEALERRKSLEQEHHNILRQLQQTQKMEAIGTLAGGIAHDFNNILSAILGYAELSLPLVASDDQLNNNLQQVLHAGNRARELIRQILTFSRQAKPERLPVSMNLVVMETLNLLRASLPANIKIQQDLTSQAIIIADSTQMHQVVMNLCTNAMHAMTPGGGTLTIQLRDYRLTEASFGTYPDLPPGDYIELTVKDTGKGMSADVLQRMYDPFFTTKDKGAGTGMGLSVVHGIVKDCRGVIRVQSQAGIGTMFHVLLPIVDDDNKPRAAVEEKIKTGKETILFVDDEEMQVDVAGQMLRKLGYQVVATTDCHQALSVFAEAPQIFDLVISDLSMPLMSGLTFFDRIREIRPDVPVILCSGYGNGVHLKDNKDRRIEASMAKPFSMKEIGHTVRQILDR